MVAFDGIRDTIVFVKPRRRATTPKRTASFRSTTRDDDVVEPLRAYDELRNIVADIEALAHAADQIALPYGGDAEQRRDVGRLGYYVRAMAELAKTTVDDAERTAAALVRARRVPAGSAS